MSAFDTAEAATRFGRALDAVDTPAATALVGGLLDRGADPVVVLVEVIAAGQRAVGGHWQRGEWTVAREHAATGVSAAAVGVVAEHAGRVPVSRGRVVVACAEREWHALPASLVGHALRAHGWDVTLLGASTPAARLNQYLHDLGPDAVAVSCSVLGALPACRRIVEAATAAGIPVLAGGPGFGRDSRRALALGATAWAPEAYAAVEAVGALPRVVPPAPPLPAAAAAEQAELEVAHQRLQHALRAGWSLATEVLVKAPVVADSLASVAKDVLDLSLHAVGAALLTGDPRPIPETSAWVAEVLTARGADPRLVAELGDLLAGVLADFPLARALVTEHWR
ncbi:cobalamin B12-binding domain-containing protein [Amycolatopsis albispora]|uniref:Twin-arginine translocation pathway signal protein n=1 Tax=Amycolatopsis albispora TaxID=1804986 RepID=A0A344L7R3_9PSEU|nr:cobalamin-dependent protein [Amycolatopsis albispora]AXB44087.1 twin-arginine translocation pathway signal protein [Amycolatopsis albispora]